MQGERPEHKEGKIWFPTTENPGNETEHFRYKNGFATNYENWPRLKNLIQMKVKNHEPVASQCSSGLTH